ncbi:MAG TPA: septum formation protein Maf [Candidatus Moranbacteria bacterium]|nr:MAG: septum formation protein Maf [Candidatus Moranbacteria bacterium GW2011_GWF1_34_10]HBI16640.1 septum formation protein Maf [Candidatus Moranbacteria bacterium]
MKRKIILASKSYWRKALLEQIGLKDFEIMEKSDYEEDMAALDNPRELAKFLALKKGEAVAEKFDDAIVLSGDTFAVFEGKFIGKPNDSEDAKKTLRMFSGKEVVAVSGFAVIDTKSGKIINDFNEGVVKFKDLSDEEIDDYVATGEPLNLAGSFGIMKRASIFVESSSGDFYSIVGFPIGKIYLALKEMGVNVLRD